LSSGRVVYSSNSNHQVLAMIQANQARECGGWGFF